MVYHEKMLRSYFTTCRRKYSGQTKSVQITMGSVDIVKSSKQQLSYLLSGGIFYSFKSLQEELSLSKLNSYFEYKLILQLVKLSLCKLRKKG